MSTPFQRATLLLAASLAATGVVSQSANYTYKPTVTTTPALVTSTTSILAALDGTASSGLSITFSTTAATSALPTAAVLQGGAGNKTSSGFGAKLKKVSGVGSTNSTSTTTKSLKARDDFNSNIVDSWLVVLEVGTPPQELMLSLDLGSDGLVVESTLVEADMQTTAYPIYNPDNSTSAQQISGYTWETAYGGFTIEGQIWTDVVTMSGTTWSNMTMEVVTAEPVGSPINTASGILGVADHLITGASPYYVNSFLGSIQDQLESLLFTIWFNSSASVGSIEFGFIDDSKYVGEIAYADVYNKGSTTFWSVNISGIGAADPKTGALLSSNMTEFTAILDTGADQSYVPLGALAGYYSGIEGSLYDPGGYTYDYPCSVSSNLPDLVLFIGDKALTIPRNTYGNWESMSPSNGVEGVDYCTGHLRPDYFNSNSDILGQDVLEGLFLVLDYDNQRVGFANTTANNDASFSIPSASGCSYVDGSLTVTDAVVQGCVDSTCTNYSVHVSACTQLATSGMTSFAPRPDSNLRCTLYSDTGCAAPLSDAKGVAYPGVSLLDGRSTQSIFCVPAGIEMEASATGLMGYCGDGLDDTTGCYAEDAKAWTCSIMYAPSSQFQFNMTLFWSSTQDQVIGTCFFYQDEYCANIISSTTGIDMCKSDIDGSSYYTSFDTYLGSHMCI